MIPRSDVIGWRARAPWPEDAQVEQDLALSRAIVELFSDQSVARSLAFRGGTALHKLFLAAPGRYSEDLDLVQSAPGPIGSTLDAVRARLDPWLGDARWKHGEGRATLTYRFETTTLPAQHVRLKIEINTREHFSVLGARFLSYSVESPWFSGAATVATYAVEELLGTKLRALYQRRKGRDLYDLWLTLSNLSIDDSLVLSCFERYLEHAGSSVTRADFEINLASKLGQDDFVQDVVPLLAEPSGYDALQAAEVVRARLIARLPDESPRGARRSR